MNCNPDINRVECWMCQRNPFVRRVPVVYAGGNPSPGSSGTEETDLQKHNSIELRREPAISDTNFRIAMKFMAELCEKYHQEISENNMAIDIKPDDNKSAGKEVHMYVFG